MAPMNGGDLLWVAKAAGNGQPTAAEKANSANVPETFTSSMWRIVKRLRKCGKFKCIHSRQSSLLVRRRDKPRLLPDKMLRPGCDPHEVKLLRNHPRLIRLVAYDIIQIARHNPRRGERRCKDHNDLES